MTRPLTVAAIGCGGRSTIYLDLAARQANRYKVVAAADPNPARLERMARVSRNPDFRGFMDDRAILAEPQLADVMVIGTQDTLHRQHAIAAMDRGYDLLLEKPIATTMEDVMAVHDAARKLGRRVMVCHVLRYTALYREIKSLLDAGSIGELVSLNATEGVEAWHQAHSYVRGHWAVTANSSPMILGKSCHDLDIIRWITGVPCVSLSSYGSLSYFTAANKPEGAPARCLDGCPAGDRCIYNAERYLSDKKEWAYVSPLSDDSDEASLRNWLHSSPWGRCVYQCDNDAVDHQTVNMLFEGGVTATFTMTAFESGRHLELFGTKGRLLAGERIQAGFGADIVIQQHGVDGKPEKIDIQQKGGGYASHLGGDPALVDALYEEMRVKDVGSMTSSLETSVESHRMAFAAESSRLSGETIKL